MSAGSTDEHRVPVSSGRAWYMVWVLVAAYSLSFADRMVMSLLIDPIKQSFAISDFQVSLLIGAAFALFYVIMGVPCGYLADRINRRNLIVTGILIWSVATAACGIAGSFAAIFIARMIVGAAEATLSPSAYSMISDSFPPNKLGRAISTYVIGNPLGTGAALAIGGSVIAFASSVPFVTLPIVGTIEGWRLVFVALCLPGIILSLLLLLTVREPARRVHPERVGKSVSWLEAPRYIRSHGRAFLFQFGGTCMLSLAVYGSMAWIPAFFIRSHSMPASTIGIYFGVQLGVCGVVGLLLGGVLGDRMLQAGYKDAYPRVMAFAAVLALAPSVSMYLVDSVNLALGLMALSLMATGLTTGIAAAAVQYITPSHLRGQMGAIYILTASVAGVGLGPTAVAALTQFVFGEEASLRYALAVLAGVSLPLAAVLLTAGLPAYRACVSAQVWPSEEDR